MRSRWKKTLYHCLSMNYATLLEEYLISYTFSPRYRTNRLRVNEASEGASLGRGKNGGGDEWEGGGPSLASPSPPPPAHYFFQSLTVLLFGNARHEG